MQRALIAALAVSALMPLQALAGSVTVRSGDTLSEIAARYGVSIRTLVRLNDLRDSDYLYEGQRLRIPGSSVTAGQATHTVVRGDNLSGIASRYRVRERDLITLNQLRQADHIEVGQRLRLPSNAVLPKPARPRQVPIKAEPNATPSHRGSGPNPDADCQGLRRFSARPGRPQQHQQSQQGRGRHRSRAAPKPPSRRPNQNPQPQRPSPCRRSPKRSRPNW